MKDYNEARVIPMVSVKGQVHESWLGIELLVWDVVQNE